MATPATTELTEARRLRHQLADQLLAAGHLRTTAVENVFRTVPRHAFAPEVPTEKAYANDIIPTRHASDGRTISSVSAPWLQADMLEAARIQPGHHVLEIGSGGYNAALLAELVGPSGGVTTLDIDPAVTDRATRFLAETGYDHVRVVTADAEHLPAEVVPAEGFDAVVVTVDTWDLPWIDALADGGRLVAPLRLHQYVQAIGFTKRGGALHSEEPLIVCGFVAMQGAGAWNANRRTVPGRGVHLAWEDGTPLPVDQLSPAFDREPTVTRTHVMVGVQESLAPLYLYLAGALPGFCRLSVDTDSDHGILNPPLRHWPGAAIVRGACLAHLANERITDGDDGNGVYELVVHGYGPTSHLAADEMAKQVQQWQRNHRAAPCPRITVQPVAVPDSASDGQAPHVFRKKHTRISIDWPVIPGTAALLTDDEGRYLLHLRSANKPIWRPGQWALLGGNTEKGETCDEAIVRELAEEIGLAIPGLTALVTLDTLDACGSFKDRVRVYHGRLNVPAHEIQLCEGIQLRWTRIEETTQMTMDPGTAAVLRAHHDTPRPARSGADTLPAVQVREPSDDRSRSIVGAHLVLVRDGAVLLGKRHSGSAFAPSTWHLPAGHREDMESAASCVIREAEEETGLTIAEGDLSLAHVVDLLDPDSPIPRIQLFFTASRWEGEPVVREPDRCTQWRWWPLTALPEPIVEYTRAALASMSRGTPYTAIGWS
ncbi:methyltransferase, FxLD system [Streptomyces sp. AcE210]|uniref:methyltransferase, FxLD system n=1 Tax=Streptomyces sp. AcE210 TaxID=2292703 RepID=UPI0014055E56|nr:methyltransferase, FxLD system [Streptomyces sp. AcE210]